MEATTSKQDPRQHARPSIKLERRADPIGLGNLFELQLGQDTFVFRSRGVLASFLLSRTVHNLFSYRTLTFFNWETSFFYP